MRLLSVAELRTRRDARVRKIPAAIRVGAKRRGPSSACAMHSGQPTRGRSRDTKSQLWRNVGSVFSGECPEIHERKRAAIAGNAAILPPADRA